MRLHRFVSSASFVVLLTLSGRVVADVTPVDAATLASRIDELIAQKWAEKKVQPAPLADDAEFIRRVYLDLVGRIPRAIEVREFLADRHPQKRQRLVSRLLDSAVHVGHLSTTWRQILLPTTNQQFQLFAGNFKLWLDKQVQENVPYDKMVREILTVNIAPNAGPRGAFAVPAGVNPNTVSPVGFYQANELKAENLAASTSRLFLGVRLECAQCHDHPFAKWSREQFWQYAAFFSAVQPQARVPQPGRQPVAMKQPNGREIKIAGTDKVVQARFLTGEAPQWKDGVDSRAILAEWLTSAENPYFARSGANRIWAHFFGIGIIDPVDDEPSDEAPVSHPELLDELSKQFIAHKFDVKYLIRAITQSQTYQRTSRATHESQSDARTFGRMAIRGLTAEQLFDSLAQATGYYETPNTRDPRILVIGPGAGTPRAEFLVRFASQEKKTEMQTSILQALALMNGKFVSDATSVERSMTLTAAAEFPTWSTGQRVEALYLAALSRLPRQEEAIRMTAYVDGGGPTGDRRRALADVFWALLNSSEFILNH